MTRFVVLAAAVFVPCTAVAQAPTAGDGAVASITEADVRARIATLAADSMAGRTTPGPGLERTAQYIASAFREFRLAPGGDDGSYLQHYPLYEFRVDTLASSVTFEGGPTLQFGADLLPGLGRFVIEPVSGPLIVIDDLSAVEQVIYEGDADGAVLFVRVELQEGTLTRSSRRALFGLYRQGPTAILAVADYPPEGWAESRAEALQSGSVAVTPEPRSGTPLLLAREASIQNALAEVDRTLEPEGTEAGYRALADITVRVQIVPTDPIEHRVPNAVGVLEGSDPELADQYILYTAHMDHLGTAGEPYSQCVPVEDDAICNGADDNASGTAAVIELAEAFAQTEPRPRRSMIFLTVSGEERGLLGSRYFAEHPTVPISQMVANINLDMVGRNWQDSIVVIGRRHSNMGAILDTVAQAHPELGMTPIDDRWPEQRLFTRSDHYNFARRGVPALFLTSFLHDDYHRPTDEVEKIGTEKVARLVRLLYHFGLELANRDGPPEWTEESYERIVETGSGR